jgi:hypothetical protein
MSSHTTGLDVFASFGAGSEAVSAAGRLFRLERSVIIPPPVHEVFICHCPDDRQL